MKIRTKLILNFMVILSLLTTIVILSSIAADYSNKIADAEKNRSESLILADALQTTSDDLTKMARLYVGTGDTKYKTYFDEILDIRNGKANRPLSYDKTYWDKRINNEIDLSQFKPPISMQELLKNSGITPTELIELEKAEQLSNQLAKIENQAFKLMADKTIKSQNQARELLYNKAYYQYKAAIREPLQNFFILISNRTIAEINTYRENEHLYNRLSIGVLILTFIFVSYFFIDFKRKILLPIANLTDVAVEVKQGNLQKRGQIINPDELGYLTESFNEMSDLLSKQILELDAQKKIMDKHAIISISNTRGDILYVNDKFTQASGYSKEDLIGKNHRILNSHYHSDDFFKNMWTTISSGALWSGEIRNVTKTGDYYWVTATIAPIMGQNQQPNGYISILTDITRQKFIELQLRDAINLAQEATKAKSAFLANMSHEIRTPMNAIIGFSELALTIDDTPKKSLEFITKVHSSAKHLLTIINDILDFSKIEAGKLELDIHCFNLLNLISESVDTLALQASNKGIDLSLNYSDDLSKCFRGDSSRIRQVIINLVGNAIKFTHEGSVKVDVKRDHDFIHIQIIDTGIGMTADQLDTIFNSFSQADVSTQRNFGGTGLGTTISKQLVEMMDGRIWAESEIGVGSHFHFTLKLGDRSCENTCEVKHIILNSKQTNTSKYSILLAEDNELNAELVLINLQHNLGHHVHWTKDGKECLDEYKRNADAYDLILMDFQMPVMDGIKATQEIRTVEHETKNHIPIIALTASATDEDRRICFDAGMDDFVMKPINISELLKKIKRIVTKKESSEKIMVTPKLDTVSKLNSLSQHFDINKGLKSWMDEDSYIKALIRFSNKYAQSTAELIHLIDQERTKEAIRYTHTIKGMSLGLTTLSAVAQDIEDELKKNHSLQALDLIADYELILQAIVKEIDGLREEEILAENSQIHTREILQDLLTVLEEDNPDPAEVILHKLRGYLKQDLLTALENTVSNFEFAEAKEMVQDILENEEATKKMTKKTILIVDDEPNNLQLLKNVLGPIDYDLKFATDGIKAISAVKKHNPDIILLDIMMPNMDGYEVCTQLKASPLYAHIPVIFVTAMGEEIDEARGFEVGCVDYIQKPITPSIVLARVRTHLSLVRVNMLENLVDEAINMLGEAGHYNDTDTGKHIFRISAYSGLLAKYAGWKENDIQSILSASTLHDTGKIGIPDSILKAPRRLTKEEWDIMKSHSQIGSDILSLSKNPVFQMAAEIALNHHERFDGKGYPNGLIGEEIPESARIVAIVDVFDALTSKRPYKAPWPLEDAVKELSKESGKHFDPRLIQLFIDHLDAFAEIKDLA